MSKSIKMCKFCGAEPDEVHHCELKGRSQTPPPISHLKTQRLKVKRADGSIYIYERKVGKEWHKDPDLRGWFKPTEDYKNGYCDICCMLIQPRLSSLRTHGQKYHNGEEVMRNQRAAKATDSINRQVRLKKERLQNSLKSVTTYEVVLGDNEVVEEEEEVEPEPIEPVYFDEADNEDHSMECVEEKVDESPPSSPQPAPQSIVETKSRVEVPPPSPQPEKGVSLLKANRDIDPDVEEAVSSEDQSAMGNEREQLDREWDQLNKDRDAFEREKKEFEKQKKIFSGLLKHFNVDIQE